MADSRRMVASITSPQEPHGPDDGETLGPLQRIRRAFDSGHGVSSSASRRGQPSQPDSPPRAESPGRSTSKVDLRSLVYLSSVDDNLLCSVCHSAFVNPVMTSCEHIFCKDCFAQASRNWQVLKCPFCRQSQNTNRPKPAPRALCNMANDLKVKCPYSKSGCDAITPRGHIQAHVDKYCELAEVDCPARHCAFKVARKDSALECQHALNPCEDCHELFQQKDMEDHRNNECQNRWHCCTTCTVEILQCEADTHQCPEEVIDCTAAVLGCGHTARRADMPDHTSTCVFAKLQPFINSQTERIENLEQQNEFMSRWLSTININHPEDDINDELEEVEGSTSPPTSPPHPPLIPFDPDPHPLDSPNPPHTPPFDSTLHHLLSSYEVLRTDIDRLSASVSELDARQSLVTLNESLRMKEDMGHLNAVVGAMRVQLHWLMSARLQQQQQQTQGTNGAQVRTPLGGGGPSRPGGGAGGGGGMGAGPAGPLSGEGRRGSEGGRQKL